MKIFQGFDDIKNIPNPVLTIGTFDGVHLGHQKIIQQLNEEAHKIGGESVLFTFYPHPKMVLYPENHGLSLIQTQDEKLDKLREKGLKNIIIHPFTKEFSRLTALDFVRDFLVNKLKVKKLVIGYDHQFGRNREGSISFLKDIAETYGFEVIEISAQEIDDVNISSTKIRKAILDGDMEKANLFLDEPYQVKGTVVKGQAIGREIGFPTANIEIDSELKLLPKTGVYAVRTTTEDGMVYDGMMNIGKRPTIDNDAAKSIEVNIFNFNKDIYNQKLKIQLFSRFRDETKFSSIETLKEQLIKDESIIQSYFSSHT